MELLFALHSATLRPGMSGTPEDDERDPWEGEIDEYGNEELRISVEDGMAYTKLEFIAYFGGTTEWDESEVVPQDMVMPENEASVAAHPRICGRTRRR